MTSFKNELRRKCAFLQSMQIYIVIPNGEIRSHIIWQEMKQPKFHDNQIVASGLSGRTSPWLAAVDFPTYYLYKKNMNPP